MHSVYFKSKLPVHEISSSKLPAVFARCHIEHHLLLNKHIQTLLALAFTQITAELIELADDLRVDLV